MKLTTEVMTIDPATAAGILANKNKYNIRKPSQRSIQAYARDIKAGNWQMNGETIIFDGEGYLLNGQSRLAAVVAADVPITTLVVKGIDRESYKTMDGGYKRDLSQVMLMGAFQGVDGANARIASAVTRMVYLYEKHGSGAGLKTGAPTRQEAIDCFQKHSDAILDAIAKTRKRLDLVSPAVGAFCYFLFAAQNRDKAEVFFDYLANGVIGCLPEEATRADLIQVLSAPIEKTNPVHVLREKLIKNAGSRAKLPLLELVAIFFIAWNDYVAGVPTKRLYWRADSEFPVLTGA